MPCPCMDMRKAITIAICVRHAIVLTSFEEFLPVSNT